MKWVRVSVWSEHGMYCVDMCPLDEANQFLKQYEQMALKRAKEGANKGLPHAVYGRKVFDDNDGLKEVRLYAGVFCDDDELDRIARDCKDSVIYALHGLK